VTGPGVWGTTTAWLFTKGSDSVRLEAQCKDGVLKLFINGPGKGRSLCEFADAASLIAYQAKYERYLVSLGFHLEQFTSERRRWPR
jgi:hypothetical protein